MSILEEHGLIMATVDQVSASNLEPLSAYERAIVGVVAELRDNVDAASITALVRDGGEALGYVREALEVLGELDPQLLVRVAIDALVSAHVDARAVVDQGH
jgi:hypothetical protein